MDGAVGATARLEERSRTSGIVRDLGARHREAHVGRDRQLVRLARRDVLARRIVDRMRPHGAEQPGERGVALTVCESADHLGPESSSWSTGRFGRHHQIASQSRRECVPRQKRSRPAGNDIDIVASRGKRPRSSSAGRIPIATSSCATRAACSSSSEDTMRITPSRFARPVGFRCASPRRGAPSRTRADPAGRRASHAPRARTGSRP